MRDHPSYLILKFHSYVMLSLGNKNGNSMNFEQLKFMTYIVRKTYVDLSRKTYVDISYFSSSRWDKSIDFCPNSYHQVYIMNVWIFNYSQTENSHYSHHHYSGHQLKFLGLHDFLRRIHAQLLCASHLNKRVKIQFLNLLKMVHISSLFFLR